MYGMIWYDIISYDIIWHDIIWHDMMWCDMTWHDMTWYDMILNILHFLLYTYTGHQYSNFLILHLRQFYIIVASHFKIKKCFSLFCRSIVPPSFFLYFRIFLLPFTLLISIDFTFLNLFLFLFSFLFDFLDNFFLFL